MDRKTGSSIIVSIKQNPFDRIMQNKKHYEFRKKLPLNTEEIYLCLKGGNVVAKLEISELLYLPVVKLIELAESTELNSGILVSKYFEDKEYGFAAKIENRYFLDNPFSIPFSPQSFCYFK